MPCLILISKVNSSQFHPKSAHGDISKLHSYANLNSSRPIILRVTGLECDDSKTLHS